MYLHVLHLRYEALITLLASKVLCRWCTTLMAKVNSRTNIKFCITVVKLFLSEKSGRNKTEVLCTEVYVAKYVGRLLLVVT